MPSYYSLLHHYSQGSPTAESITRYHPSLSQKRREDSRRNKISNRGFEFWLLVLIRREMGNPQMKGVPYQMAAVKQ